jgi:insulysin
MVLPNGLRIMNIQDERALETAFAMAVQSGLYNDPVAFPGLAHFCEHMVFLGTEKYPEPSGFDNFMGRNGGSNNAYTASDRTVYFGQIAGDAGYEAMDRFADFFRAPLFNRSFVEKEVHAIDSEHAKNVQNPTQRVVQTFYALSNPEHPMSKFHTGNLETLFTRPQSRNENPVDALEVYFRRYYCPDKMRLVTFGSESLERQYATAKEIFGTIPEGSEECRSSPVKQWSTPAPWTCNSGAGQSCVGNFLHIQGTQPTPALWIHFPLPALSEHWASRPLTYINYVLSYSGVDSITRTLTDQLGLATDCGTSADENSAGTNVFYIVTLTEKGLKDPVAVMDIIFSYLAQLRERGVDEALYQSLANITSLEWDWGEMQGPMSTVEDMAARMTHSQMPVEKLLSADKRILTPNPEIVASLIELLTPENMNAALVYPPPQEDADSSSLADLGAGPGNVQQLPYYNVSFKAQDLDEYLHQARLAQGPAMQLQGPTSDRWLSWLNGTAQAKDAGVPVPKVPSEVKDVPAKIPLEHMHAPTANASAEGFDRRLFGSKPQRLDGDGNLWYRSGWVTMSPKVSVDMHFSPFIAPNESEVSSLDSMRLQLYSRLLSEEMEPKMVDLVATGVSYSITVGSTGISVSFGGFAPLMPKLVDLVLTEFKNFNQNRSITDSKRFKRVVDDTRETLSTYDSMPVQYASSDMNVLLLKGGHSRQESLASLGNVTIDSVAASAEELMLSRRLQLRSLAMGNLEQGEAQTVVGQCADDFQSPDMKAKLADNSGEVELFAPVVNPRQPIELRKQNPRADDPNDVAIVALLYGVKTVESRVLLSLLGQILGTEAYNELRTVRQLGYVVQGGASSFSNVLAVKVMVQGTALDADEAEAAIQAVITDYMPRKLESLTASELESMKSALLQQLLVPPVGASEEVDHFWAPVRQGGQCFDLQDKMIAFLNSTGNVTREKMATMWGELATPQQGVRKRVTVKYFSGQVPPPPTPEQAAAMWQKQGVPEAHQELLRQELNQTLVLDRADSEARKELLKGGSYFPSVMNC